eukprot:s2118_g6.t1
MQGLKDLRGLVLPSVLRCAWLLQVDALLLECVDNVTQFGDIQNLMDTFAELVQMHVSKIVFDLIDQWPVRRRRFWCLMYRCEIPELALQPWPQCPICTHLGAVTPFDALWPDDHEYDLLWDPQECAIYSNLDYAHDLTVLQSQHQAPTMLHSWAHILRACPCGCRSRPFSEQRLLQGGARGFGLLSAKNQQMRHLHPEEGSLLCTVPLDFGFQGTPRSALCLLGQIAAPLQVLWLQAQFLAHLHNHFWLSTPINPHEATTTYKWSLVRQRVQRWILANMYRPRSIQLSLDGHLHQIQVREPVTVWSLERAETELVGRGHYAIVSQHGYRLPPWCQLHTGETYDLMIITKKRGLPPALPSSSIASSDALFGHGLLPTLPQSAGLGDTHVWAGMKLLLDFHAPLPTDSKPWILYPFRATHLLQRSLPNAVLSDWQLRYHQSNGTIMAIFEFDHHWTFLMDTMDVGLTWTFFDGLSNPSTSQLRMAQLVAEALTHHLGLMMCAFLEGPASLQHLPYTCGTVALLHMAICLKVQSCLPVYDEQHLHAFFLGLCDRTPCFQAHGPGSLLDTLAQLLISKGVPESKASDRAQLVKDKLGQTQLQQIMKMPHPWPSLKAAASKPGKLFRLVTEEELKDYVNLRAKTKHGAAVTNAKAKKQASSFRDTKVQLDPAHFRLDPKHFQDASGGLKLINTGLLCAPRTWRSTFLFNPSPSVFKHLHSC